MTRKPVEARVLPDDLYDYLPQEDIETPPTVIARPPKHDVKSWTVTDDWPERVPVTDAEIDLFEAFFGDILDQVFSNSGRTRPAVQGELCLNKLYHYDN